MKILVFGSLNIDHVYRMPHLVRAGETIASISYQKNAGGKGLNQAIALAKAGQAVRFAGAIGKDGLFLREYLEDCGVDISLLQVLDEPTGHAMIQLDSDGQNAIVLYGGANQKITAEMIREVLEGFDPGDFLLLQNEINLLPEIVRQAKAKGMQIVLNPSPMSDTLRLLLPQVDWLILNEVEGEDLTGCADPETMVRALLAMQPACRIVLTLGAQGAMYADHGKRCIQPAFHVETVDITAAGDTFTGFFLSGMLEGQSVEDALLLAAKAAAIAVSRSGASKSIPSLQEVTTVKIGAE